MDAAPHASTHLDDELDAVLIGGREPGAVEIADYDPRWRARFEAERRSIAAALGPLARRIEHIGSTSVPDLAASPAGSAARAGWISSPLPLVTELIRQVCALAVEVASLMWLRPLPPSL